MAVFRKWVLMSVSWMLGFFSLLRGGCLIIKASVYWQRAHFFSIQTDFVIVMLIILSFFSATSKAHPHVDKDQHEQALRIHRTDRPVQDITQDHRGILYFASSAGVLEFDGVAMRTISLPNDSGAYRLLTAQDGRIYVGGEGEMGYLAPDDSGNLNYISLLQIDPGKPLRFSGSIINIHSLPDRVIFVAEKQIFIVKNNHVDIVSTDDYFYSSIVLNGSLFVISGQHGFQVLDNDRLQAIPGGDFFRAYYMLAFEADKILIMTQRKGAIIFDPKVYTESKSFRNPKLFSELAGPGAKLFKQYMVTSSVLIDHDKYLIGLMRYGMLVINSSGQILMAFNQSNELISNDVYALYKDSQNHIWAGLDQGIMPLREMYQQITTGQKAQSGVKTVKPVKVDSQLPFAAMIRKVEAVQDDELLFGGAFFKLRGGIQTLNESELTYQTLPYEKNTLRFNFSSNHIARSDQVEYQTYLKGLDKSWTPWSKRIYREFSSLPWKEYTFFVRARDASGTMSEATNFTFLVLPPWYETFWFYGGQVMFFMLLLLLIGIFRGAKRTEVISEQLIVVITFIALTYLRDGIGVTNMIAKVDGGVPFFKIVFAAAFALLLEPIKKLLKKAMGKIQIQVPRKGAEIVK